MKVQVDDRQLINLILEISSLCCPTNKTGNKTYPKECTKRTNALHKWKFEASASNCAKGWRRETTKKKERVQDRYLIQGNNTLEFYKRVMAFESNGKPEVSSETITLDNKKGTNPKDQYHFAPISGCV